MPLSSVPLDILLVILRDLDIVDVVRTGMTCKALYGVIQDRHIWIDQLEKLRRNKPALRSATPPLASLLTQELKTLATGWAKLRHRWDKDGDVDGFTAKGLVEFSTVEDVWILPGGKSLLIIGDSKVRLCRIELEDSRLSLSTAAKLRLRDGGRTEWSELLTTMSPYPILIHKSENIIHLIWVDHHNGAMGLETTFPMPTGYSFIQARGWGRVVGFLIQRPLGSPQMVVIHLDHPGASVESKVPGGYRSRYYTWPWGICIPAESLLIVYTTQHILAYEIPSFSSLSLGVNRPGVGPMWVLPGPDTGLLVCTYMTSESLHESPSAQEFNVNLYYVGSKTLTQMEPCATAITIPIDTKGSLISRSAEPRAVKKKLTPVQNHGSVMVSLSRRKGLQFDVATGEHPSLHILVTSLNDLDSEGGGKALWMHVSSEELAERPRTIKMDMDEVTGRVVVWGDSGEFGTQLFVGDLV